MTVGYPDFARLSRDGGYQFYGKFGAIPENTTLFKGYCGNWPYIDLFTGIGAESSSYQFFMEYYAEPAFTNQTGYRIAVRTANSFATTQYGNLSEWLWFFYLSEDGSSLASSSVGLFGTTGNHDVKRIASLDVPILENNAHIAATTLATFTTQKIMPGPAQFSFLTGAASWYVQPQYFNYGSNAWNTLFQITNAQYPNKQFVIDMPMIDAPMRVQVNNGDASSQNFIFSWVPK